MPIPLPIPIPIPIQTFLDPHWWALGFASIVQCALFVRWVYRSIRNEEIMRVFVQDMAQNHLPQIYECLEKICVQQGIEPAHRPPIRWMNFEQRPK